MNSKQLAQDRRLKCGYVYEYHKTHYLVVMTNNDKSRGLIVERYTEKNIPILGQDAYFFNENAEVRKKPLTQPVLVTKLTDGDFILSEGTIYEYYYADEDGVMFRDYPSGACPILFQIPLQSEVDALIGWADIEDEDELQTESVQALAA